MRRRRAPGPWRRLAQLAAILILAALFGMSAIAVDGLNDNVRPSDVAIVLGNSVTRDGRPLPWLRGRLDRARMLYAKGQTANIIVSGAPEPNGQDEATVMRNWLIENGVPAERIIADSAGVNTLATARDSAAIMKAHGWKSATAVTQFYHISRTRFALRRMGISPVYTAHAYYHDGWDLYSLARELAANVSYRWKLR